MRILRFRS